MSDIIIAIDGPAGSGKTTTARLTARELNYLYIDTGAMYRAVTLAWLRSGEKMTDENLYRIMEENPVILRQSDEGQRTILNGEDVSDDIRTPDVNRYVSPISAMQVVRDKMVRQQQEIGKDGGVVLDGRDIGTVVFPKAQLKIFLLASIDTRAKRRMIEQQQKGIDQSFEEIREQIIKRDDYDSSRDISPLRKADDAVEIDTSELTIEEQVKKVLQLARERI